MALYDVHQISKMEGFSHVIVLQSDFYDFLEGRLALPLFDDEAFQIDPVVNPLIEFDGQTFVLKAEFLGPFSKHRIGRKLGTVEDRHYEITRAIDRLMSGV